MLRRLLTVMSGALIAGGCAAFMFAHLFGNLVPLSAGFAERQNASFVVGWLGIGLGLGVYLLSHRPWALPIRLRHVALLVASAGGIAWLTFAAVIFGVQDDLIFKPRALSADRLATVASKFPLSQAIEIPVDAATLHGWLLIGDVPTPAPLVILFAGQGGEASRYMEFASRLPCCAWAFVNYRGYGLSTGTPSDSALFADAVAIFDYLAAHPDIDSSHIFALGGSLGAGVATFLAAHRPLAGAVLFSPYDRIAGGVTQDMMPFVPTQWLVRYRFDALAYAPQAQAPAVAIVGDADAVIRPARSARLMASWGQPHQLITVPGGDHYSIYDDDGAWTHIAQFVADLMTPPQASLAP